LLGHFNAVLGREHISKQQLGMKVYMITVLTVGLQQQTLPHVKILSKTLPFHIKTFINTFGPLLIGRFLSQWSNLDRQEMVFKYTWCMIFQGSGLWYWSLTDGCKNYEAAIRVTTQPTFRMEIACLCLTYGPSSTHLSIQTLKWAHSNSVFKLPVGICKLLVMLKPWDNIPKAGKVTAGEP